MIPFEEAVRATLAEVTDAGRAPSGLRVVTDTRSIEPGDAFLALRGERFDGHDYVGEAIARGASALIVDERNVAVDGVTTLIVPDTLRAYLALARVARDRFEGRVIAVTGSTGKTTTKDLLAQLLRAHYGDRVAASPANENNEIGVSRFLLGQATGARDVLVVEMGARHYDDIAPLVVAARPDIGILTNVGEAHVEIMGSRERLAHTKWGLFSGGALAVLNACDEVSLRRAPSLHEAPHWFAATDDERISTGGRTTLLVGRARLIAIDGDREDERPIDVRLPGAHNRANLAAAIAGAREMGVPLDTIVATVPGLQLPKGRYEAIDLPGRPRLIYDAYNANLSGMFAALDAFAAEAGERRIAVLSSMAELGPEAPVMHEQVGERAAATALDVLLVGGTYADELARGAAAAGLSSEQIVRFASNEDAAQWIDANGRPGDVVLLKGSRVYALEEIVERLRG
ncbi:MAG: UDP-N-acetylmuramoyl-tripeptide--D-alanyl-D-alanine ligase [Candidatus Eremiobacteraeota bacterium]|nr:UDP-N-acetylmuramoyl-tripeptide--D-alanyl-D-alanine ligase [Candidatus Eremiobacteraeota bacterium]